MPLSGIETPYTALELAESINNNLAFLDENKVSNTELGNYLPNSKLGAASGVATLNAASKVVQTALNADVANDMTPDGPIAQEIENVASEVADIVSGNTIVGKARTLEPVTAPGNNKVFGTSASGVVGWFDAPTAGGETPALRTEPFTNDDARWGAAVSGVYTLTIPHAGGYPVAVFKQDGAVYTQVSVDIQRDNTNMLVRTNQKFDGYVIAG